MIIDLVSITRPVRTAQRRYDKILQIGFPKPSTEAQWVAAAPIVPKPPLAHFGVTIDLLPVISVTVSMTCPISNIESQRGDVRNSRFFASIEFVSGYGQLPLEKTSQPLHTFMTTKACLMPTRTL